jgi:enoyl-CoA hydratase/carnithine racemase
MTCFKKNVKIYSMKKASNILIYSPIGGISRIKINTPNTYNALSMTTLKLLIKAFKSLNNDNKTKVIILESSGKGFSSGHNLKEINSIKNKSKYKKLFNLCSDLMLEIVEGKKPVIAKVHGAAFAAGCQLVASCDLAISSKDAIFATPGVNIGLFCSTPMVAVSRKVSRKKTMKMLLTGSSINAKYAKEIGLINDFYPIAQLNKEVLKLAKNIATKSNFIIKIGKKAFYKQLEMPLRKAYKYTSSVMVKNMEALDAREGISAFLEKRNPKWKNK